VNFVDDDGADGAQHLAAAFRGQQQVERLGRRDQNVRRRFENLRALRRGGVAGANRGGDLRRSDAGRLSELLNPRSWNREILVDVGAQRFERRDVDDARFVGERPAQAFLKQVVEPGEKGGERLARSGRRRDERMASRLNLGPAAFLRRCGRAERVGKPARDDRMKGRNSCSLS
jgi:hypothetical protein